MKYKSVILFDGICNFCNSSVNFIIKRDNKNYFRFSTIQSEFAKNIIEKENKTINNSDSIILVEENKIYLKSTAALKIAKHLKGFWRLFFILIIIPPFIRNFFYDIISRNRYKWFGKRNSCMITDENVREKFL